MTETQWRFLKAISDRVPDGRIVEVRLFPAIRQGGAESGVAVVAVEELFGAALAAQESANVEAATAAAAEALGIGEGGLDLDTTFVSHEDVHLDDGAVAASDVRTNGNGNHAHHAAASDVAALGSTRATDHEVALPLAVDGFEGADVDVFEGADIDVEAGLTLDDMLDLATTEAVEAQAPRPAPKRYAVLAARYRLTLKGPDRGHWDFELTHEADAPLDTVDRVARGVARRAGDEGEPESFSAFQLRSTLSQPWWNTAS